jgi:hypothetical protein
MTLFRGVGYDQRDTLCGIRYWKGRAAAGCTYLLLAPFDGAEDQGYTNGQVLDTEAEGVAVGSLTVVETDGVAALVSDHLSLSGKSGTGWTLGTYGTGYDRVLGRTVIVCVQTSGAGVSDYLAFGWHDSSGNINPAQCDYSFYMNKGEIRFRGDVLLSEILGSYVVDTSYQLAFMLGGFDTDEQCWYSGAEGTYIYGAAMLIKGGAYTTWTMLRRISRENTATLYPFLVHYGLGYTTLWDYLRISDHDYSAVLQPTVADYFTDTNSVSLADHTPNVVYSGGWNLAGAWDIQTNKARLATTGIPRYAYVETGQAGVFVRVTVTTPASGTFEDGLIVRYQDINNYFKVVLNSAAGAFQITRILSGGSVVRATTAFSPAAATTYEITFSVVGNDLQAWVDGGKRIAVTDTSFNTATKHGLFGNNSEAASYYDNFHGQPSSGYTALDTCPGYAVTP